MAEMIKLENDYLEVLIAPQYGGKIWRAYDKHQKRELFLNNPALQPANFANRGAWVSGGVEFNWNPGHVGHSEFTLSPVYAARLDTERGPVVRVWEHDRRNSSTWQVDIFLDGPVLYMHPKLENRWASSDLPAYWWTNVAMATSTDGSDRILAPAKWDIEGIRWPYEYYRFDYYYVNDTHRFGGLRPTRPWATELDFSYLANLPSGNDFFFELCDASDDLAVVPPHCAAVRHRQKPFGYIALAASDGHASVHGHRGQGTKFFTYGATDAYHAGQFLQDFMSASSRAKGEHRGNYLEMQTGRAVSQFHTFTLPARSKTSWTEWFRMGLLDSRAVHASNYSDAIGTLDAWIEDNVPQRAFDEVSSFLTSLEDIPVREEMVLARGMPWGGLEQLLLGNRSRLSESQLYDTDDSGFDTIASREARPWRELLRNGTFSAATLASLPTSYMISSRWVAKLEQSVRVHGATWLHHLHLGTAAAERGDKTAALTAFAASWKAHPSPIAARNLALLAETASDAWDWLLKAWACAMAWPEKDEAKPTVLGALSREMATWALEPPPPVAKSLSKLHSWLTAQNASAAWQSSDAVQFARARLAVQGGEPDVAVQIIRAGCWPTFLQAHQAELQQLWEAAQNGIAEKKCGCTLSAYEKHRIRLMHPAPPNLMPPSV